jgi:hypothetical protein
MMVNGLKLLQRQQQANGIQRAYVFNDFAGTMQKRFQSLKHGVT